MKYAVAMILVMLALNLPASAQAADPQPLGAVGGDCTAGDFSSTYSLPPTPGNHPSTIQMARVSKAARWSSAGIELLGADTVWRQGQALQAGIPATGFFMCLNNAALGYSVTHYDTPTAPASFSGAVTPGSNFQGDSPFGSELVYIAPGAAPYVADVAIAQGAIRIGERFNSVAVASTKTVELGETAAGQHSLSLTALDGPQAVWTVTIRPLPIQVTGLAVALPRARPGATNTIRYTTNGDTRITAAVTDSTGATVRILATAVAVTRGDHTFTWDGTDRNGRRLRDGVYGIRLLSMDPVGNRGEAQARVVIDGRPRCGANAAVELERSLPVRPYRANVRLGQTLCFDFTGDARKDIVFTGWTAMNHGAHYWAAFQARAAGWKRVKFKRDCCRARRAAGQRITRSGRTIIVTQPIYRGNDPACCPAGGKRQGRWRWKGGQLKLIATKRLR